MAETAFMLSQMGYGKGEYNIEICGIEVLDFLSLAYPGGIGGDLDMDVVERYGLAINFAKKLQEHKKFALSTSFGKSKERNVYCGHIHNLPTLQTEIVVDRSTVEFLAGGLKSFLSLSEGKPIASARVKGFYSSFVSEPLGIFFRKKVIPAP